MPTKSDLTELVAVARREAEKFKAELDAIKAAVNDRFYTVDRRRFIALPLTYAEAESVRDYADDEACRLCCEGKRIETESDDRWVNEMANGWRGLAELPQFYGLVIRYGYSTEDGTDVLGIWGLMEVK